jgi:hypothetical protein
MDTNMLKRSELIPVLVDAATKVAIHMGADEKLHGCKGRVRSVEFLNIFVMYRSPKADIIGVPSAFGVDVWYFNKKSFSACWNSNLIRDFELVSLKRGPWISDLLAKAAANDTQ